MVSSFPVTIDLEKEAKLSDEFDTLIQKLETIDKHLLVMKSQILYLAGSIEHLKEALYNNEVATTTK